MSLWLNRRLQKSSKSRRSLRAVLETSSLVSRKDGPFKYLRVKYGTAPNRDELEAHRARVCAHTT